KATAKKAVAKKAASRKSTKGITPKKALANTRKLLQAKQEQARQGGQWPSANPGSGQVDAAGYQSDHAQAQAEKLHEAEMHRPAQLSNISSRDRQMQSKRDRRGS
ncbi:MAG: hypothetical protein Q4F49_06820, partial [Pseudoxanthomonas suwonensis]|nr:hypothetical protein [Pseudoxanthomonas suwonensis]